MFGFNNVWSQHSKVALGRIEQWKIYPNLDTEYLQCYLGWAVKNLPQLRNRISPVLPRSRSYHLLWATLIHRWTDFINKKMGEMKWSRKKNYQPVLTWLSSGPGPIKLLNQFTIRRKRLKYIYRPESVLIVWKYLLILHKCDDIQAKLLQWFDFR